MTLDPALFRPEAIDEESQQLIDRLRDMAADAPPMHSLTPQEVRAARAGGRGPGGQQILYSENAIQRTIPGPGGDIGLRCFIPERVDGAYLYIHGGGWVLGTNDSTTCGWRASKRTTSPSSASTIVWHRSTRIPPARTTARLQRWPWCRRLARSSAQTELFIGGDSAGAHLAVVALLRLRDRHGLTPFSGAVLATASTTPT